MAKKIFIVDDDPSIIATLKMVLETAGYVRITARDGQEALDKIGQDTPDLMILDMTMPKIDGYTLFKRLKPEYGNIPIIMLTASTEIEDAKKCIAEGAVAYLTKPFKPRSLLGIIKGLLGE
jgi:DNA-binding response OmpR family regulator